MENNIVKLSDAVSKLLEETNKDKSLGEVSAELNDYLIEIKELVESNEISYDELKEEIRKHLNSKDKVRPGSVAQLLMGCVKDECPLYKETAEDISFIYDNQSDRIVPLTKFAGPISSDSYCVLYINNDPSTIKIESLRELEAMGFEKLKIKYKTVKDTSYKTINIENIEGYIYHNKSDISKKGLFMLSGFFLILLLIYLYARK